LSRSVIALAARRPSAARTGRYTVTPDGDELQGSYPEFVPDKLFSSFCFVQETNSAYKTTHCVRVRVCVCVCEANL